MADWLTITGDALPTLCPTGSKRIRNEIGWFKSTCGFGVPPFPLPWVVKRSQASLRLSRNCQPTRAELVPVSAFALLTCETSGEIEPGDNRNPAVVAADPG